MPVALLDAVAELSAVSHVLAGVGIVLRPSVSSGPQYPEWGENMRFARSVLQIAEDAAEAARAASGEASGEGMEWEGPATLDEAFEVVRKKATSR